MLSEYLKLDYNIFFKLNFCNLWRRFTTFTLFLWINGHQIFAGLCLAMALANMFFCRMYTVRCIQ